MATVASLRGAGEQDSAVAISRPMVSDWRRRGSNTARTTSRNRRSTRCSPRHQQRDGRVELPALCRAYHRHSGIAHRARPGTHEHRPLEYGFRARPSGPPRN